jgi:hypothetical protein
MATLHFGRGQPLVQTTSAMLLEDWKRDRSEWREDKAHLGVILRTVSVWYGAHLTTKIGLAFALEENPAIKGTLRCRLSIECCH